MTDANDTASRLVGVLDMGASAIRLVIADVAARGSIRVIEEASRGVPLGRDSFSSGSISSRCTPTSATRSCPC
jgi:exopolyphosphatase/pppGpp-phosphohydrolase